VITLMSNLVHASDSSACFQAREVLALLLDGSWRAEPPISVASSSSSLGHTKTPPDPFAKVRIV